MKKLLPIILMILLALTSKSQIRICDSLYLWVDFRQDKILINIPDQYFNYQAQWAAIPSHVRINKAPILVPNLPEKGRLLTILTDDISLYNNSSDKVKQLKFLGQLVLLLFYSNNDLNVVSDDAIRKLNDLSKESSVINEAALVLKWVEMIKKPDN